MLDIETIRADPEGVRAALLTRVDDVDLDAILDLDAQRRALIQRTDEARSNGKRRSRDIGAARKRGQDTSAAEAEVVALRTRVSEDESALADVQSRLSQLVLELPNLPDPRAPIGGKEANQVVRMWGEPPEIPEDADDHVAICQRLGLVDYERGVKLGGNGFWIYTGLGAAMEWALLNYFCQQHFAAGYRFILPPHLLTPESGVAAGQFPKFHDDVFHITSKDDRPGSFLLPTSETALLNLYRDEILDVRDLPQKLFAYTPCYRLESGSHRSDERGTIRGHQFNKVEMFHFIEPEQADASLAELIQRTEGLVEGLGLHHRTSLLGTRDASATMALTYDVEVWFPSLGSYKEVSSASWAGDYQARRARIRYRPESGKGTRFVHTLNASGLATSRLMPAIVEQCQQPDGSVVVPEVLRPWLGVDVIRSD